MAGVDTSYPIHVSRAQILKEHAQRPPIGNGMMNRKHQHVIISGETEHLRAIERALHQIEGLAENFLRQFFDGFWLSLRGRDFAEPQHRLASIPNHLHGLALARKERQAKHLLPVHHLLQRRLGALWGPPAPSL